MGIEQVRLYTNTFSQIPGEFQDVTANFPGTDPSTVVDETVTGTVTVSNLTPDARHFFWTEVLDEAANTSGIVPVGSRSTRERYYAGNGLVGSTIATASSLAINTPVELLNMGLGPFISENGFPQYVQYELEAPRKLTRYRLRERGDGASSPSGWRILGSNDGDNFQVVHDVQLPSGTFLPLANNTGIANIQQVPDDQFHYAWPYTSIPVWLLRGYLEPISSWLQRVRIGRRIP